MCGHVGLAGDLTNRDTDAFNQLLWAGALRGMHSTGAAFVAQQGRKVELVKKPGSPMQIWGTKEFRDANNSWTTQVAIGHNRFATVGSHTEENAHPFKFSNIVGAHNGTLEMRARKLLVDNEKFGTDSEALFHNINHFGVEEVIAEMSGAWALVWYDRRDHTINFLRNEQRPFHYTFNQAGDVIYWASESGMLRWILSDERLNIPHGPIYELNPNVWASFTVAGRKTCFGEPRTQEVMGWKPAPFVPSTTNRPRGKEEEMPWTDGQELRDVFTGWYPQQQAPLRLAPPEIGPGAAHNKGSPVMETGSESSPETPEDGPPKKKQSGKQQNAHDGLPGLPKGKQSKKPSEAASQFTKDELDTAWSDGFVAGGEGRSKTHNPFPADSEHYQQWLQGRLAGLDTYKPRKKTDSPPQVKGYNAEWIDEDEFYRRTGGECRWGGCNVEFGEKLQWLGRNDCVCEECVTGNKLVRELLGKAM